MEARCRSLAVDHGCLLIKLHHGIAGFPDRILIRRGEVDVYMEFKRAEGGRTEKIQRYWQEQLRRMGKTVDTVKSVDRFRFWLTA